MSCIIGGVIRPLSGWLANRTICMSLGPLLFGATSTACGALLMTTASITTFQQMSIMACVFDILAGKFLEF